MKKVCSILLAVCILCSFVVPVSAATADRTMEAVYLGVKDYGTVNKDTKDTFDHNFYLIDTDREESLKVAVDSSYALQNKLQEGYIYQITVSGNTVTAVIPLNGDVAGKVTDIGSGYIRVDDEKFSTSAATKSYGITAAAGGASVTENPTLAVGDTVRIFVDSNDTVLRMYKTFVAEDYTAPVSGTPGLKTLKNFIATALEPVGTALYVYGGAWNWQDDGSSNQATTIGLSQSWIDFFQSHDANYTYKITDKDGNSSDFAHSYYPNGEWNQYYSAGIDCSGYVGWVLYNLTNAASGNSGYVASSRTMAKACADRGWGIWTKAFNAPTDHAGSDFHVGDIFSMNGHVWISLGTCDDGSIVIMHSTPSDSKTGQPGGGVQISALNPKNPTDKNCEAYQLTSRYMTTYYPAWSSRYDAALKNYTDYTTFSKETAGKFTWDVSGSGLLSDPDGYANMTPAQILADLYSNVPVPNSTTSFTDVPATYWAHGAIEYVSTRGLFTGASDGSFNPGKTMSRSMLWTVMGRLDGQTLSGSGVFAAAKQWAVSAGVSDGSNPSGSVTRAQLAAILWRYAGSPAPKGDLGTFTDAGSVSGYAKEALAWAVESGIINGTSATTLNPSGNATRAQVAAVMMRYCEKTGK